MNKSDYRHLGRILGSRDPLAGVIAWWKQKAPKRKPISQRKIEKAKDKLSKKVVRAEVRAACILRSGDYCECGCGRLMLTGEATPEMDHFYGRARAESVGACWMLCRRCHREKTENRPTAKMWDHLFAIHCGRYGYPVRYRRVVSYAGEAAPRSGPKLSKIISRSTP